MSDWIQTPPTACVALTVATGRSRPQAISSSEKEAAVSRCFETHRDEIYTYLLTLGLPTGRAEELTQETFIRLFLHVRAGGTIENARAWLFRVAHNLRVDEAKRPGRRETLVSETAWEQWEASLADEAQDPEAALLRAERFTRVWSAIRRLPPESVQYLYLRARGLSYREIAEIGNVSLSKVVDSVRRAIERLGKELR